MKIKRLDKVYLCRLYAIVYKAKGKRILKTIGAEALKPIVEELEKLIKKKR